MSAELRDFLAEVRRSRDLLDHASTILSIRRSEDVSDIYRAALALSVSAYDRYIHALVLRGMIESANGTRPRTNAFGKFRVTSLAALSAGAGEAIDRWFAPEVVAQHTLLSFQKCDKVADAIRLISSIELWIEVGRILGESAEDVKLAVNNIMDRRNQIVHEADRDPLNIGQKRALTRKFVNDAISRLTKTCRAIDRLAA